MDELKLSEIGPKFEHHKVFPARTNTGLLNLSTLILLINIGSNKIFLFLLSLFDVSYPCKFFFWGKFVLLME